LDRDIAVYVHWPFCLRKCPYCDFNSHVGDAVDHRRWRKALLGELSYFADQTKGRRVTSIFFGGGTPSLMEAKTVAQMIAAARRHWPGADDVEVTLEANPTTVEAALFKDFRAAGVNRLSLGIQSFDDQALVFLGRTHGATEAVRAFALAADIFPRSSFDLIYARPGQTAASWRDDLERAADMAVGHLSLYQLSVERGTEFAKQGVREADEATAAELYEMTQQYLSSAGLEAYEISNHARPGQECRHNVTIWQGGDYVGVGPGAHGRLRDQGRTDACRQIPRPDRWLDAVERTGHGTANRMTLGDSERVEELLMTGLRLTKGIEHRTFQIAAGRSLRETLAPNRLEPLIDGGFLILDDTGLRATATGLVRLNAVIAALIS
jgi:putative oxygen-independent coproporphyrinogen III oxidase